MKFVQHSKIRPRVYVGRDDLPELVRQMRSATDRETERRLLDVLDDNIPNPEFADNFWWHANLYATDAEIIAAAFDYEIIRL